MAIGGGNSRKDPGGGKSRKDLIQDEGDELLAGVQAALHVTSHHDSIIAVKLSKIKLDDSNGRFGQVELMSKIDVIVGCIREYISVNEEKIVPEWSKLKEFSKAPELSISAMMLYKSCANLANTYLENEGRADTPPKVCAANAEGIHLTKTGHRRTIAYHLAEPITGVNVIDVILDKSTSANDTLYQSIGRITENTARENNTLAELIVSISRILDLMQQRGEVVNKAKLAQATAIERTKLGRIIEVITSGLSKSESLITSIHENGIEDIKSLSLIAKQSSDQWTILVEKLIVNGSAWFRNQFKQGAANETAQAPLIAAVPVIKTLPEVVQTQNQKVVPSDVSTFAEEPTALNKLSSQTPKIPPAANTNKNTKNDNDSNKTSITGSKQSGNSNNVVVDPKEAGAIKVLTMLKQLDNSITLLENESGLQTLEKLLVKLGEEDSK